MTPVVHGRGDPPMYPPHRSSGCAVCGKAFGDREHRGVQTHMYQRADGLTTAVNTPPRRSVDEMATAFLTQTVAQATMARAQYVSTGVLAAALQQVADARQPSIVLRPGAVIEEGTFLRPELIPPNPDREGAQRHHHRRRPRRHRRFPCTWWKRRCRCHECHRTVDYARIEAMERECEIRGDDGELVWKPPQVGDRDEHGCTLVSIDAAGMCIWDRPHPPAPPPRDPGRAQWV